MVTSGSRRRILTLVAGAGCALAGCFEADTGDADTDGVDAHADDSPASDWRTEPLEDVTTGETCTIGGFDRPVFLHTFAIWCGTCQRQHREFAALTGNATDEPGSDLEPQVVELSVDPDEQPDAVREHVDEYGFDWKFVVAPSTVTESLVDEIGPSMASPPQSPVVLICPDGELYVFDDRTVVAADTLDNAVETRC